MAEIEKTDYKSDTDINQTFVQLAETMTDDYKQGEEVLSALDGIAKNGLNAGVGAEQLVSKVEKLLEDTKKVRDFKNQEYGRDIESWNKLYRESWGEYYKADGEFTVLSKMNKDIDAGIDKEKCKKYGVSPNDIINMARNKALGKEIKPLNPEIEIKGSSSVTRLFMGKKKREKEDQAIEEQKKFFRGLNEFVTEFGEKYKGSKYLHEDSSLFAENIDFWMASAKAEAEKYEKKCKSFAESRDRRIYEQNNFNRLSDLCQQARQKINTQKAEQNAAEKKNASSAEQTAPAAEAKETPAAQAEPVTPAKEAEQNGKPEEKTKDAETGRPNEPEKVSLSKVAHYFDGLKLSDKDGGNDKERVHFKDLTPAEQKVARQIRMVRNNARRIARVEERRAKEAGKEMTPEAAKENAQKKVALATGQFLSAYTQKRNLNMSKDLEKSVRNYDQRAAANPVKKPLYPRGYGGR